MPSEREKMISGALYDPGDAELVAARQRAQQLMRAYNATVYGEERGMLADLLRHVGESVAIRTPFYVDYGVNITVGTGVFMNYGVVILDAAPVHIGDGCDIAPYVQILTADHPRGAAERATGLELARPVTIGRDVWIGAAALILPGVTIGDGAVVGAGAVVTRDVAPGVTVAGNPARPLRGQAAPSN